MNMDKPLRRVAIFALLLIFGLMAQVNYVQGTQAKALQDDQNNARRFGDIFKYPRGKILAGDLTLVDSTEHKNSTPKYGRKYAEGPVFAPITGFFNGGASGLELSYNSLLSGRDKRLTTQRWFDSLIGKKPEGADIETTIDPEAQRVAYKALQASTTRRAAAVVMDVKTGAIKVMASYPSFDPNSFAPQTKEAGAKKFEALNKDRNLRPAVNKVLHDNVAPGSSFKALIAASALANGINKDSNVPAPSAYKLPGTSIDLPNSHEGGACGGLGTASLIATFAESCNTTFGILGAERLGPDKVIATAKKFAYDQRIEIEPDLKSVKSAFPKADGAQTALASIGQGSNVATPLHMCLIAAAAGNDGKIMKPYLVQKVRAKDQSVVEEASPKELAKAMNEDQAGQLADMMRQVVTDGTGKALRQFNIAGKTGTADIDGVEFNNRWFVGFSPIEKPRYAFAVWTQGDGSGGEFAGPIAGKIMQAVRK
ncbi:peptidoglycan D,D-transpeptidase FtsI family protein [Spirillospora sp. CA-294931]|uniref:peptidoglycan D,D-transpeptidase FtsI family protein n=1 Tax=Spirillospora sp. CA-294931 TaxID=3240042 RepID=UPI003D9239D8